MPTLAQRRLAGFRFEIQPPPVPEKLPRMDIAVFVGFASAGPLDLPVVIEDADQFLQLFGDDIPLAWDARHGRMIYAHLGPAVRAFFRNGGRRCWVIRVAGEPETDFFPLPGMLECAGNGGLRAAFARARSAGSWFDRFQCATALMVKPVTVTEASSPGKFVARLPTGTELQAGDLVRLRFPARKLQFFVVVREVGPATESPANPRSHSYLIEAKVKACFEEADPEALDQRQCDVTWTRVPQSGKSPAIEAKVEDAMLVGNLTSPPGTLPPGRLRLLIPNNPSSPPVAAFSPPPGSLLKVESGAEMLWFRVASVGRDDHTAASPPGSATSILGRGFWFRDPGKTPYPTSALPFAEKLTFELRTRRGDQDAVRLTELGFVWENARCWSALPDDQALFDRDGPPSRPAAFTDRLHDDLRREAGEQPLSGARFPVAGTGDTQSVFLPLLVQPLPDEFLPPEHSETDELTRDGLNYFQSSLFLDKELIETTANSLLGEADFIRYQRPDTRRLRGIHAALEVEEATLIAVPDAVHVGWNLAATVAAPPAPAVGFVAASVLGIVRRMRLRAETGDRRKTEIRQVPQLRVARD